MTAPAARLRVGHVTLGLAVGGLERLLVEMIRHGDHTRFDVTVIALTERGPLADAIEAAGARVIALDTPLGFRPSLFRRLAKLFREERFDVVHTHDDRPLIYGIPAARWAGVPCRIHTHHHGRLPHNWRQRWLIRFAARYATRFVCVSDDSARFMAEQGAKNIETLWNGIDLTRFAFQGPSDAGSIVTVARLCVEKDIATLLRAAAQVVGRFPDARFEIAGAGPCRAELEQLAETLRLNQHVRFLGEVSDVPSLLARARLFVLPSLSEGISLTLLEAMARGLPLVTTNVGGNPEVVAAGVTGLLVSAGDPTALAQAIEAILADAERGRQMGRAGRARVEDHFDIRKMMARYEAMYACGNH